MKHEILDTLFNEMKRQGCRDIDMAVASGVSLRALNNWHNTKASPTLSLLEAALNVVGLTLGDPVTDIIEAAAFMGLSQRELCREAGIHKNSLWYWAKGKQRARLTSLVAAADVVGVTLSVKPIV